MDTTATTPTANSQAEPRFRFANYYLASGSRVNNSYNFFVTKENEFTICLLLFGLLIRFICVVIRQFSVSVLSFSSSHIIRVVFVCVWFLPFYVIRLIGLQAGSHERAVPHCLLPLSLQLSRKFAWNERENKSFTPKAFQISALTCPFFFPSTTSSPTLQSSFTCS